jgi:hypothetical protein
MLRAAWVDEIFTRLTVRYGRDFLSRWEGLNLDVVKADWAEQLAFYDGKPEAIKHALSMLPSDRPPTAAQFRDLCRLCPAPTYKGLPAPDSRNEAAAKVLLEIRRGMESGVRRHPKAWALELLDRAERGGEPIPPHHLRIAREALADRLPAAGSEGGAA